MKPVERVLDKLSGVRERGGGWQATCPAHDDRNPSLSITEGDDGRALIRCHAGCDTSDVLDALELSERDLFESRNGDAWSGVRSATNASRVWDIRDASGSLIARHHRRDLPNGEKRVWWSGPGGEKRLKDVGLTPAELPLYGADFSADWHASATVVLVEGEPSADALRYVGIPTVATVTGASGTPGEDALAPLAGRKVVLWPDADDPGREHMRGIAERLEGVVEEVRIFDWPDAPDGGDAADHPAIQSPEPEDVRSLVDALTAAPQWKPEVESTDAGEDAESNGHATATINAADLMAKELPPVRWCVPGLLPEGVTILAGKPKLGKSWLAFGLAIAVASGGVALGTRRVERGECLYLALEDNQRRLQKRLSKLLNGDAAPNGLHIATSWRAMDDGGADALDAWLSDHPECRLVIVDVLQQVRPHTSHNQSVYAGDYLALQALRDAAAKHGVAVLVVHHLRKAGADDPLDEISGSTGLSGAADGMLVLKRDRGRGDAYLHVDGRDIEEPAEHALTWNSDLCSWTLAGDADSYRLSKERAEIIAVLEETGEPMTPTEVAEALGKSFNTIKQRLWHMSRDGQVSTADGRYSLPTPHNSRNRDNREEANGYSGYGGYESTEGESVNGDELGEE